MKQDELMQEEANKIQAAQNEMLSSADEIDFEIDEESLKMLAKFDARGVTESKIMTIFRASAQELEMCRKMEDYIVAYSSEILERERMAMSLDTAWDEIEEKALGDLRESMSLGAIVDPRQQLVIATQANKMARRSTAMASDGLAREKAHMEHASLNGAQSVVVKLRTKFVEKINREDGHERLIEREAEVIKKAPAKVIDDMSVAQVRKHIAEDLNIDLGQLKVGSKSGPDIDNVIEGTATDVITPEPTQDEIDEFELFLKGSTHD